MPSCPYTVHEAGKEIAGSRSPIAFCRENCQRTFFHCPRCNESNRSLARFCRRCGEIISFDSAAAEFDSRSDLFSGRHEETYSYTVPRVKDVRSLVGYRGHLFVIADQTVFIYDFHKLSSPLKELPSPDRHPIRGVTITASDDDVFLLLTTARGVYRYNLLLPDEPEKQLYRINDSSQVLHYPTIACGNRLYLLIHDQTERASRLAEISGETIKELKGLALPPLVVADKFILFCAESQIFLYDTEAGSMIEGRVKEPLDREAHPSYSSDFKQIYLVGGRSLWRVSLEEGGLNIAAVNFAIAGAARVVADRDEVFIADANGFAKLNLYGERKWDSEQSHIKDSPDGFAPQLNAHYVLFTALGRYGGSTIRIHPRRDPGVYEPIIFEKRLLCPPLLSFGRFVAVVGDGNSVKLEVRQTISPGG